jgi:uroporphyrinogen decarboxylase
MTTEVEDVHRAVDGLAIAVDDAQGRQPPGKAWVRDAIAGRGAPRCPVSLRRFSYDLVARQGPLLAELLSAYPDDVVRTQAYEFSVGFQPPGTPDPIDPLAVLTGSSTWTDEWGTTWEHARGGVGASPMGHPLEDWDRLDDYLANHMPDPAAPGRLDGARASVERHAADRYFIGASHMALFERFHFLRGMTNTFEDMYAEPARVERLLDALADYAVGIMGAWRRLGPVDGVFLSDDWGSQVAMMISPEMWRRVWAPRYRRVFDEAHRLGLDVMFHSCGNVHEIIGDLIDVGVDLLDPLQPEALDIGTVARDFGGKVAFSGGISDQLLEVYTPGQVRDHVRRTIDTLGAPFGNAYLVSPSNVMMPTVPPANLVALFETCHDQ